MTSGWTVKHLHGNMKDFLKLIRWQNLLIVAATMLLMRYGVLEPILSKMLVVDQETGGQLSMKLQMPLLEFILLIGATVLITAGGYVINDYFDIKTDLINRGKVIVGTTIPRREAMTIHNILNILGVAAGYYISWKAGYFWLGTMFLMVSGLLYFYSASYKRQFLIGNLIVAALTAMVPLLVAIYEWPAMYSYYSGSTQEIPALSVLFYWTGGFAFFAFLTTLAREIIKDIEDYEGDSAYGRNTLPIVLGIRTSKSVATFLVILTAFLLMAAWYLFVNDAVTLIYMALLIVLPLLYIPFLLWKTGNKSELHKASRLMKIVMITGILYSVVVTLIIKLNLV
jgi:4-hydroxybenzoate polyprenyltransferase